jgi:hypothetical protein
VTILLTSSRFEINPSLWRGFPILPMVVGLSRYEGATMTIAGGCLCGAVRFTINADAPLGARHCWCRVCQYLGAGSGAVGAVFRKEGVTVSGQLTDFVIRADSGSIMHRRFCSQCGTPVFSEAEQRPDQIFLRVGTFDDPNLAAPSATIWTKSAPVWACFDPSLPRIEGQPPPVAKT